jgi:hypothetical protein
LSEQKPSPFVKIRDEYLANAELFAGKKEYRKASELLWGAVTQAIKALAAKHKIEIKSHGQFYDFMQEVCRELKNESLYKNFLFLNDLHKNFYDESIRPLDFDIYLKEAYNFILELDRIMKEV